MPVILEVLIMELLVLPCLPVFLLLLVNNDYDFCILPNKGMMQTHITITLNLENTNYPQSFSEELCGSMKQ